MKKSIKVTLTVVIAAIVIAALSFTAISVYKSSPGYKLSLAERYLSEKEYEQAIIEFEKLINIEPKNADYWLGLADAYEKNGQLEKAKKMLEKSLNYIDNEDIRFKLAEIEVLLSPDETTADAMAEVTEPEIAIEETTDVTTEPVGVATAAPETTVPETTETTPETTSEPENIIPALELLEAEISIDEEARRITISEIPDNPLEIAPISEKTITAVPAEIGRTSGNISGENQEKDYSFMPSMSGVYRFELADVTTGAYFDMAIYNSGDERLDYANNCGDGGGITIRLDEGQSCYIRIKQRTKTGSYTLVVGQPKETPDVSKVGAVNDTVEYTEQENRYEFTPGRDGLYRFELSDVQSGVYCDMRLYNSGWERIDYANNCGSGGGITRQLTGGKTYVIVIQQRTKLGSYTLNIGKHKEAVDVSYATAVTDSVQFTDQENDYLFTPVRNGYHRFEFSNVQSGVYCNLYIYNSGWERIDYANNCGNGNGITVKLSVGKSYFIKVKQHTQKGDYTLKIGRTKDYPDISSAVYVDDVIQYTDQQNEYDFTPTVDGLYRFELSDVQSGTYNNMYIFNSGGERLDYANNCGRGSGITIRLKEGQTYFVVIKQRTKTGAYTLAVGHQKEMTDISSVTSINDSIDFTDQENNYIFTPSADGTYRFELSDVQSGVYCNMNIYNSGWERINYENNCGSGDGITIKLSAGQSYIVTVEQRTKTGTYTLKCITP